MDPVQTICCALCEKHIPSAEADVVFCHGCKEHVCEDCCVNDMLMGPHNVEKHADGPEYDEYEDEDW